MFPLPVNLLLHQGRPLTAVSLFLSLISSEELKFSSNHAFNMLCRSHLEQLSPPKSLDRLSAASTGYCLVVMSSEG